MMSLLEAQGLGAEMEKVPPARPQEQAHPLWNLYVPEAEVPRGVEFLRRDWAELLDLPDAAAAAARGIEGVDLDAGGEVTCPACGHRFTVSGSTAECPSAASASEPRPTPRPTRRSRRDPARREVASPQPRFANSCMRSQRASIHAGSTAL
jgi:hypothetical protein